MSPKPVGVPGLQRVSGILTRQDEIQKSLEELRSTIPGVEAAVLSTFDGLVLAASSSLAEETSKLAALGAAMLSLSQRVGQTYGVGDPQEVDLNGSEGRVIFFRVAGRAILVVSATINPAAGVNMGLVLLESRNFVQKLTRRLEATSRS